MDISEEELKKIEKRAYAKGYRAGANRAKAELDAAKRELALSGVSADARRERVYMQCLGFVVEHCRGWTIDGKKVNGVADNCRLANIFTKNAISQIDEEG